MSHLERVMDVLMAKLDGGAGADGSSPGSTPVTGRKTSTAQPGGPNASNPHYYVIHTVSAISVINPIEVSTTLPLRSIVHEVFIKEKLLEDFL